MPYADPNQRRERVRAYHRDPANRATVEAAKRRWREANAHKRRAQNAVNNAVRVGRLTKEPCLFCDAERVEAHHHDYTKPLEVTWLCKRHHTLAHSREAT